MNEGRGTDKQFQIYGHSSLPKDGFTYTPVSMSSSKYPKEQDKLCGGVDLTHLSTKKIFDEAQINLEYLIDGYNKLKEIEDPYFLTNGWINKLAGTANLQKQIEQGLSAKEIRQSWATDLEKFRKVRAKYLIYED